MHMNCVFVCISSCVVCMYKGVFVVAIECVPVWILAEISRLNTICVIIVYRI